MTRFVLLAIAFGVYGCASGSTAALPPRSAECDRLAMTEIAEYIRDLDASCGTFASYSDCPDFDRIEARYRARDRATAEQCETPE